MPPATPAKVNTLIFDVLAISAVEGDLHEGATLQEKAFRLPQGGHIHPRRVQGEGP